MRRRFFPSTDRVVFCGLRPRHQRRARRLLLLAHARSQLSLSLSQRVCVCVCVCVRARVCEGSLAQEQHFHSAIHATKASIVSKEEEMLRQLQRS